MTTVDQFTVKNVWVSLRVQITAMIILAGMTVIAAAAAAGAAVIPVTAVSSLRLSAV
jgi:hypothetical protein